MFVCNLWEESPASALCNIQYVFLYKKVFKTYIFIRFLGNKLFFSPKRLINFEFGLIVRNNRD